MNKNTECRTEEDNKKTAYATTPAEAPEVSATAQGKAPQRVKVNNNKVGKIAAAVSGAVGIGTGAAFAGGVFDKEPESNLEEITLIADEDSGLDEIQMLEEVDNTPGTEVHYHVTHEHNAARAQVNPNVLHEAANTQEVTPNEVTPNEDLSMNDSELDLNDGSDLINSNPEVLIEQPAHYEDVVPAADDFADSGMNDDTILI